MTLLRPPVFVFARRHAVLEQLVAIWHLTINGDGLNSFRLTQLKELTFEFLRISSATRPEQCIGQIDMSDWLALAKARSEGAVILLFMIEDRETEAHHRAAVPITDHGVRGTILGVETVGSKVIHLPYLGNGGDLNELSGIYFVGCFVFQFSPTEIGLRPKALIAFGADIFLQNDHENLPLWKNDSGFDTAGVDYLLKTRREHYIRRRQERTLKRGDRVAVFGCAKCSPNSASVTSRLWRGTLKVTHLPRKQGGCFP